MKLILLIIISFHPDGNPLFHPDGESLIPPGRESLIPPGRGIPHSTRTGIPHSTSPDISHPAPVRPTFHLFGYLTSSTPVAGWERRTIQLPRADMSGSFGNAYLECVLDLSAIPTLSSWVCTTKPPGFPCFLPRLSRVQGLPMRPNSPSLNQVAKGLTNQTTSNGA